MWTYKPLCSECMAQADYHSIGTVAEGLYGDPEVGGREHEKENRKGILDAPVTGF